MFSIVAFSLNNKGINQENRFSFLMNFLRLFFCINLIVLVVVGGVWSFSYQTFRDIVERYRKELIRSNPSMSAGDNI
jgi:hypothetical protein